MAGGGGKKKLHSKMYVFFLKPWIIALENILGCHYELDDFQIRSVTEGREAMGEAVVKLRSNGKLYSGRGTSTDIVGSSIQAYISALNKIVYEEACV